MSSVDRLTRSDKLRLNRLRTHLLGWYKQHGRALPWRKPETSVFERICVEVLLQRTRAETVARFYEAFFDRFSNWAEIASCPLPDLEKHLKPIGLWQRRARSLHALSEYAAARGGKFPRNEEELADVPGVGQYVANAILLFQYGEPRPLVDVNMARVIERYLRPRRLADIRHDPWLQAAAHWLVDCENPALVNWAVLDLGSARCLARSPRCERCELASWCNTGRIRKQAV
jgi:A/G-specific adenine glycosylase